jgi:hypothetical protein
MNVDCIFFRALPNSFGCSFNAIGQYISKAFPPHDFFEHGQYCGRIPPCQIDAPGFFFSNDALVTFHAKAIAVPAEMALDVVTDIIG